VKKQYLPTYKGCMLCGQKTVNPHALGLRFRITAEGVETPFTAEPVHQGYANITHGGMITAVLDETIGWAVAVVRKRYFVTGELTVRFVKYLPVGKSVLVRGRALEHRSRYSTAEGEIVDEQGVVYATAQGKFILMPDAQARSVDAYLSYQADDLHILDETATTSQDQRL